MIDAKSRIGLARRLIVVVCAAELAACAVTPTIHSEMSPTASFSNYRTYNWIATTSPPSTGKRLSGDSDWRMRNDIASALMARGWAIDPAPDVLVDYAILLEQKHTDTFVDFAKYVQQGGREGLGGAYVNGYDQGTLAIELYDGSSRQLLWRSTATAVVSYSDDGSVLRNAVQQMFVELPTR